MSILLLSLSLSLTLVRLDRAGLSGKTQSPSLIGPFCDGAGLVGEETDSEGDCMIRTTVVDFGVTFAVSVSVASGSKELCVF